MNPKISKILQIKKFQVLKVLLNYHLKIQEKSNNFKK